MASTIPAAIDGLLAAVQAQLDAAADTATKVIDGFPRKTIVDDDIIAVGGKAEPVGAGTVAPIKAAELPTGQRMENYTLAVYCSSSRGKVGPQKPTRDRAFALMGVVDAALSDDVTLGGVVRTAQIEGPVVLLEASAENKQAFAEVAFTVAVEAVI